MQGIQVFFLIFISCFLLLGGISGCTVHKLEPLTSNASNDEHSSSEPIIKRASGVARRAVMSRHECNSANGEEVGDIGDGRIHQVDYRCANGEIPLGSIKNDQDQPIATEGSVCCGTNP